MPLSGNMRRNVVLSLRNRMRELRLAHGDFNTSLHPSVSSRRTAVRLIPSAKKITRGSAA